MTTLGFCTHFSENDEFAFEFAFRIVRENDWQMTICHWLYSPYRMRRDMVADDLFHPQKIEPVSPELLTRLEFQLRQYYEPKLEDFTNVAFKLCEGQYQVELARCLHANLLDIIAMGYPPSDSDSAENGISLEEFASRLNYPIVIVSNHGTNKYLLNSKTMGWLDKMKLTEGSWEILEPVPTL